MLAEYRLIERVDNLIGIGIVFACHLLNPLLLKLADNPSAMHREYRQLKTAARLLIYKLSSFPSKTTFDQ
jgi:hypothetical protein